MLGKMDLTNMSKYFYPVRALILSGMGLNCEEEMAQAYRLVGAKVTTININQILEGKDSIHNYDILNFPGGFSYGDDLGSGKALANLIRFHPIKGTPAIQSPLSPRPSSSLQITPKTLLSEISQFLSQGKFILGVCNGFQLLVKLGLLPNTQGRMHAFAEQSEIYDFHKSNSINQTLFFQEATLTTNSNGRFEDRWCRLKVPAGHRSPFLTGISYLELPVRHGEGHLIISDPLVMAQVREYVLDCLHYVDERGEYTEEYPANPNGSPLGIAGLSDKSGQILGIMPHPEAYLYPHNHPDYNNHLDNEHRDKQERFGQGYLLFKNIVEHIEHLREQHSK